MTLTQAPAPAASVVAHRVLAEAHQKAAQVLRQRNPEAAARHAEQARGFQADAEAFASPLARLA